MRDREQRRGAGCLSFGAGRRTLLWSKDRGQEIGGKHSIGKEGSCKNKILLTWEVSKRQGRRAGCRGDQGNGGWGGRMEGVLDSRQPRQYDWAGLSLAVPSRGAWKELVRGVI